MRENIRKAYENGQLGEMIYMKDNGEISKRKVQVIKLNHDSFQAYCFRKRAKRTFKINNVLAFFPVVTGKENVM